MNNQNNNSSINETVMQAVQSGMIKMRPKWHFILRAALAIIGSIVLALFALYLASFIFFMLLRTGAWFIPAFGFHAIVVFLISLPWLLILLTALFVIILEVLVRRYSFAYRWPLLYSAIAIILIVLIGGFAVAKTPIHKHLIEYDQGNGPLCCGGVYRDMDRPRSNDIHIGMIIEFTEDGFRLQDRGQENLRVVVSKKTRLPYGSDYSVKNVVVVFGPLHDNIIDALGVRRIEEMEPFLMDQSGPPPVLYQGAE
ncbi:MAG: hypothetical protein NTX14_00350 [Candidatus Nealsonbacteria bacterium]|nr:hypothetical protein [Candidatus Nealsonbacteria bacterium]